MKKAKVCLWTLAKHLSGIKKPPIKDMHLLRVHSEICMLTAEAFPKTKQRPSNGIKKALIKDMP